MEIKEIRRANLLLIVDHAGSNRAVAEKIGAAPSQISQIITRYRGMGHNIARRLEKEFNLPKGAMDDSNKVAEIFGHHRPEAASGNVEHATSPPPRRMAPIINTVTAGSWGSAVDIHPPGVGEASEPAPYGASNHSFWMRVKGDSMVSPNPGADSFPPGTLIHVDPEMHWDYGDYVVAKLDDSDEATFKQVVEDAGRRYLKPLNNAYDLIPINGNCRIVGKVTEYKRKL